jgi:hypothetical protein
VAAALDFIFRLHLAAEGDFDEMLGELAATILRQAGYPEASITSIAAELRSGAAAACTHGSACDVEFRAQGGELTIALSQAGRSVYRTMRRLP